MPACEAKGAEGFGAYTGDEGLLSASVMQGASTVVTAWLDAPAFCFTDGSEPAAQSPFSGPLLMLQGLDTVRKGQWAKFGVLQINCRQPDGKADAIIGNTGQARCRTGE